MQKNIAKQGYNSVKPQNWLTLGKILECEVLKWTILKEASIVDLVVVI